MSDVESRASRGVPKGAGIIRKVGWEKVRGKEVFRAIVDFPNGPPPLEYRVIWDRVPVTISEYTATEGSGQP